MLRKRIIFTLIYDNGFFHQSRNFRLQKVGDINWLEKNYKFNEISFSLDELIVLNVSRTEKNMEKFLVTLNQLANNVFIPISVGGGINTINDAKRLFDNGADKIVLNTALFDNPDLIKSLVKIYGAQSIIASVDYKIIDEKPQVFIKNGTVQIDKELTEYIKYIESLNIGEIYLNSIDKDGTGFGYDLETINTIAHTLSVPLIIAGGAGNEKHLLKGLEKDFINATATANLFNFIGNGLPNARKNILKEGLNLAQWK